MVQMVLDLSEKRDEQAKVPQLAEKLRRIAEEGQDYEFYPTKKSMARAIFEDLTAEGRWDSEKGKLLDIGAGDGNFFRMWDDLINEYDPKDDNGYRKHDIYYPNRYYAIEKSKVLIEYMDKKIITLGSDFLDQGLINKSMDMIFSNPPYMEYEPWAEKIIREANAYIAYLIIPKRWENSKMIKEALSRREAACEVILEDDFYDAPRKARCKVHVLRIDFRGIREEVESDDFDRKYYRYRSWRSNVKTSPFDLWFKDSFPGFDKWEDVPLGKAQDLKERLSVVKGQNLIERLESLYQEDLDLIRKAYEAIQSVEPGILRRLGIKLNEIKDQLKEELSGMKNLYWKELFDNLDKITDRLTSKSRNQLLGKLQENQDVDFTADNAYQVVLWAIKNANQYFDNQLVNVFENLIDPQNINAYKSNTRYTEDSWKYCNRWNWTKDERNSHFYINDSLDYRLVCTYGGGIAGDTYWSDRGHNGLSINAYEYLHDICTIAGNLGFDGILSHEIEGQWESRKLVTVRYTLPGEYKIGDKTLYGKVDDKTDIQYKIKGDWYHKDMVTKSDILFTVRAYMNGNMHFKINQRFLKKLNIEVGRIKGWINSKKEAQEELNLTPEEAAEYFKSNIQLESLISSVPQLIA